MDKTEKKINQILNLLNLTHEDNMFFMETLSHSIVKEEDLQVLHEYMKKCNTKRECICSGMYEDEIEILN